MAGEVLRSTTARPAPWARSRALDGIRGASWVAVFFGHADLIASSGVATMAMFVFFALSGFLITGSLLNEHERTGRISLRHFFARRALRLVPALACFLLIWLVVIACFGKEPWTTSVPGGGPGRPEPFLVALEAVGSAIGYITNWTTIYQLSSGYSAIGHLWSLAVEEQFYLLWAPLLFIVLRRSRRGALIIATVVAAASTGEIFAIWNGGRGALRIEMGADTRAGAFFLGAAVALAAAPLHNLLRRGHLVRAVAIAATFTLTWSTVGLAGTGSAHVVAFVADTLAAPLLIASIRSWSAGGLHLLRGPILTYLGERSYALYLWHYVWLTWLRSLDVLGVGLALAASIICAEASWRLVERRALAHKKRFEPGAREAPTERGRLEGGRTEHLRSGSDHPQAGEAGPDAEAWPAGSSNGRVVLSARAQSPARSASD
jgi:peptidoglycan/LPS O-acetylase OafA/YrhL